MEQLKSDLPNSLIAPHELRELLTRLTEQEIEGIPATEARTLAGLSLQTGVPVERLEMLLGEFRGKKPGNNLFVIGGIVAFVILALVNICSSLAARPAPEQLPIVTPPPVVAGDTTGLLNLSQVTYGPDSGTLLVDPTFTPPLPVPAGISIECSTDNIMWGAGDHRAATINGLLSAEAEAAVTEDFQALAEYVRESAARRGLPTKKDASASIPWFPCQISIYSYNGICSAELDLPAPGHDIEARARIAEALKKLLSSFHQQLQIQLDNRRASGP